MSAKEPDPFDRLHHTKEWEGVDEGGRDPHAGPERPRGRMHRASDRAGWGVCAGGYAISAASSLREAKRRTSPVATVTTSPSHVSESPWEPLRSAGLNSLVRTT